ncbi:unnamed protein product [Ambrosiozyma monospora]|uniref:Unnamed protein product n=1 Tax=Ambrosiozyma monospora TaxID=43982 RepID=A0ACB5T702_AMBMO|nr:unnamed protein product [Ambrosiozyma monospora]
MMSDNNNIIQPISQQQQLHHHHHHSSSKSPTPTSSSSSTTHHRHSHTQTLLSNLTPDQIRKDQQLALQAIRNFLHSKNSFDVLPVSYRLIVFETSLLVKRALNILLQNSIVSAPLWNSKTSRFAGLLTSIDFINVIQYYAQHPDQFGFVDGLTLDGLRDVEKAIGVKPLPTVSIHPFKSLYEACVKMIESSARQF